MSITAAAGLEVKNYSEASGFVSKEGVNHGIRIWKGALIPDEDCGMPTISRSRHKAPRHGPGPPASRGLSGTGVLLPRPLPACSCSVAPQSPAQRCGHGAEETQRTGTTTASEDQGTTHGGQAGAAHHGHLPAPRREHLCCRPWGGTGRNQHHEDLPPPHLLLALYDVFCARAEQGRGAALLPGPDAFLASAAAAGCILPTPSSTHLH